MGGGGGGGHVAWWEGLFEADLCVVGKGGGGVGGGLGEALAAKCWLGRLHQENIKRPLYEVL